MMKNTLFIYFPLNWMVVPLEKLLSVAFILKLTISWVGKAENKGHSVNTSLNLISDS